MNERTRIGKIQSSKPNLQNIPIRTAGGRRIREAFPVTKIDFDYGPLELRLMKARDSHKK